VERASKQRSYQKAIQVGGKGKAGFMFTTFGIRSFLGITEPTFRAFKTEKADRQAVERLYFGLWDAENRSLVVAKDDLLVAYGNAQAEERLAATSSTVGRGGHANGSVSRP
jgi:hypothetical protein